MDRPRRASGDGFGGRQVRFAAAGWVVTGMLAVGGFPWMDSGLAADDPAAAISTIVREASALDDVAFPDVIRSATGRTVIAVDPKTDAVWLDQLRTVVGKVVEALNDPAHPIHDMQRINEASRCVENQLAAELNRVPDWRCEVPKTESGAHQRSGYPDLVLTLGDGSTVYLDPKLVAPDQIASTLRTFYYQPKSATNKVTNDARHVLVGFRHNGQTGPALRLDQWYLVDLAKIRVRLKAEFQASNDDVYRAESIIAEGSGSHPTP